ncbi:MAG: class I SAM-dependent methyltransferase [Thermoguttaceae bacterium]
MDYERLSREHFDRQAPEYDQRDTWYYSREGKISCRDVARRLNNSRYSRLLDVGCGTGYLFELLQPAEISEWVGIDISPRMIEMARAKNIPGAEFLVGPANHLPFTEASFDVVVCSQSFHHYPYQREAMNEVWRVLKPGGLYILADTGLGGLGGWFDNHILFKLLRSGDCKIRNRFGIEKMMRKNGFEVLESYNLTWMIYTVVGRKTKKLF